MFHFHGRRERLRATMDFFFYLNASSPSPSKSGYTLHSHAGDKKAHTPLYQKSFICCNQTVFVRRDARRRLRYHPFYCLLHSDGSRAVVLILIKLQGSSGAGTGFCVTRVHKEQNPVKKGYCTLSWTQSILLNTKKSLAYDTYSSIQARSLQDHATPVITQSCSIEDVHEKAWIIENDHSLADK